MSENRRGDFFNHTIWCLSFTATVGTGLVQDAGKHARQILDSPRCKIVRGSQTRRVRGARRHLLQHFGPCRRGLNQWFLSRVCTRSSQSAVLADAANILFCSPVCLPHCGIKRQNCKLVNVSSMFFNAWQLHHSSTPRAKRRYEILKGSPVTGAWNKGRCEDANVSGVCCMLQPISRENYR